MEINKEYSNLLREYMTEFYNEVLVHRAVPETRDALMEVQRRILYTMYDKKYTSNKPYVKCAKINGNTMTYHYHGNASIFLALVNMSQDFKNHIPLVDTNGNNGTIYGDKAAAERYLEARLSKDAELIYFSDFNEDSVDFIDNFDLTEKEPLVLPSRLPIYFINGCYGIAAGYAISIPPHNPNEVIDETIKLIKDPNYEINLRPDLPNGCSLYTDDKNLDKAYKEGRGSYTVKGKFVRNEKKHSITITEIPYLTTLSTIKNKIKELTKKNGKKDPVITFIKKMSDGSDSGKIDLELEIKKDYTLEYAESMLYNLTRMKLTLPFILVGTIDRNFKIYKNATEVLKEWIEFRVTTIKRIKLGKIKKYKYRLHLLEGLLKVIDPIVIDEVIEMIKNCNSDKEVIDNLMDKYGLTKPQADYIGDFKLRKLAKSSVSNIKTEICDLTDKVNKETKYFKNKQLIYELIIEDLLYFKDRYKNIKRKTLLVNGNEFNESKKLLIEDTEHTLIVTHQGYIKKLAPLNSQRRNGKGITVGKMRDDDYPVFIEQANNRDNICIFTNTGKVYKLPIYELNENTNNSYGNFIANNINGEKITSCIIINDELNDGKHGLLIATKMNKIKITSLEEFKNISKSGIIATKLNEGDEVISVNIVNTETMHPKDIMITSSDGISLYIDSSDVSVIKRTTFGVSSMNKKVLERGAFIASVTARYNTDDNYLFILTKKGTGKLVSIDEFSKLGRGSIGVKSITLKDDDEVVYASFCNKEQELNIVTNKMIVKIPLSEVSEYKRPAYGLKIKNMDSDEEVIDASIF